LGGFFFVDRSSSTVIFLSSRTSTLAAKIVKTTLDEGVSNRLIGSLGTVGAGVGDLRGDEDPLNPKSDEKNPLAWWETPFSASVLDVAKGFSDPTVYTHRATSASI